MDKSLNISFEQPDHLRLEQLTLIDGRPKAHIIRDLIRGYYAERIKSPEGKQLLAALAQIENEHLQPA